MKARRHSTLIIEEPIEEFEQGKIGGISEWLRSPIARVGAATLGAAYLTAALTGAALAAGHSHQHGNSNDVHGHSGDDPDANGDLHSDDHHGHGEDNQTTADIKSDQRGSGGDADANGDLHSSDHHGHGDDNQVKAEGHENTKQPKEAKAVTPPKHEASAKSEGHPASVKSGTTGPGGSTQVAGVQAQGASPATPRHPKSIKSPGHGASVAGVQAKGASPATPQHPKSVKSAGQSASANSGKTLAGVVSPVSVASVSGVRADNTVKSATSGTTPVGAISAVSAGSAQVAGVLVHAASVPSAASVQGVPSTQTASAGTILPGQQNFAPGQVSQVLGISTAQVAKMTNQEVQEALQAAGAPPSGVAGIFTEREAPAEQAGAPANGVAGVFTERPDQVEVAGVQAIGELPLTGEPFIPGTAIPAVYLVGGLASAGALLRRLTRR